MGGLSFLLGWAVTVTAGLMSYPIDTIRRHDDDFRWWSQVQGFHRLRKADHEDRGFHEHDEGSRSEHSPWWLVLVSWLALRSSTTSTSSGGPARSAWRCAARGCL